MNCITDTPVTSSSGLQIFAILSLTALLSPPSCHLMVHEFQFAFLKIGGEKLLANEVPAAPSMDLMSRAQLTPVYGNKYS